MVGGSPDGSPVTYDKSEAAHHLMLGAEIFRQDAAMGMVARREGNTRRFFWGTNE